MPVTTTEPAERRRPRGAVRDGLVAAGVELARAGGPDAVVLREGIEYPIWSTVHGLAVLTEQGPLRDAPGALRRRVEGAAPAFVEQGLEPVDDHRRRR